MRGKSGVTFRSFFWESWMVSLVEILRRFVGEIVCRKSWRNSLVIWASIRGMKGDGKMIIENHESRSAEIRGEGRTKLSCFRWVDRLMIVTSCLYECLSSLYLPLAPLPSPFCPLVRLVFRRLEQWQLRDHPVFSFPFLFSPHIPLLFAKQISSLACSAA